MKMNKMKCEFCGKEFSFRSVEKNRRTCSKVCGNKLKEKVLPQELLDDYATKFYSIKSLGEKYNLSCETIGKGLYKLDLHLGRDGKRIDKDRIYNNRSDTYKKKNKERDEYILKLYNEDMLSVNKIEEITGYVKKTINRILNLYNVVKRDRSFYITGEKNYNWRGGCNQAKKVSNRYGIEDREWVRIAKEIRKRDNKKCQMCGTNKRKLAVHHIIPGNLTDDIRKNHSENLITLCVSCHGKVENKWYNYVEPFRNYLTREYGYKDYPINFYNALKKVNLV